MEERDQQEARRAVTYYQEQQDGVYLIHSQVRRIKEEEEEEEARELLLKLQLLETRPAEGFCPATMLRASRSLSPLRRAGGAIPVGE